MLNDLERLYRPRAEPQRLRRLVQRSDGLENVLSRPKPNQLLRRDVLAELQFESLLEVAYQTNPNMSMEPRYNEGLGDLFAFRDPTTAEHSGRWLPLLLASRKVASVPVETSDRSERLFVVFLHVDATIRFDPHIQAFSMALAVPSLRSEIPPLSDPRALVEACLKAAGAAKESRKGQVPLGFRNFVRFSRDLAQLLADAEGLETFRAAVWQYYTGWFQQFMPNYAFERALAMVRDATELGGSLAGMEFSDDHGWTRVREVLTDDQMEEPGSTLHTVREYRSALKELSPQRNKTPDSWHQYLRHVPFDRLST